MTTADALIEQITSAVHARGMTASAVLFLETHKPLTSMFRAAAIPVSGRGGAYPSLRRASRAAALPASIHQASNWTPWVGVVSGRPNRFQ